MKTKITSSISKILLTVLTLTLLCSLVSLPAFALENEEQLSRDMVIEDNYQSLTFNGKIYVLIDGDCANSSTRKTIPKDNIKLSAEQESNIDTINAYASDMFIFLDLWFTSDESCSLDYIDAEYYDAYVAFMKGHGPRAVITNYVTLDIDFALVCTDKTLTVDDGYKLHYYSSAFDVVTQSEDGMFSKQSGEILFGPDGKYYYFDNYGLSIDSWNEGYILNDAHLYENITLYEITNADFINSLNDMTDLDKEFEDNETGDDYDTTGGLIISAFFLSIIFGFIPFVILVACIILAIMTKKPYKWVYLIAAALCALTLIAYGITFIIIIILLFG